MNSTIKIEKSTSIYLFALFGVAEIQINSSISSNMMPKTNITEFDIEGFIIQLDTADTYRITGFEQGTPNLIIDLTIVIYASSVVGEIPGFPLLVFFGAILLGILVLKLSERYRKRYSINFQG